MDFAIFKLIKNDETYYKMLSKKEYPKEYINYAVNYAIKNNILGVITNWVPDYVRLSLKKEHLNQILDAVIKSDNIYLVSEILKKSKNVFSINMIKRSELINILIKQTSNLLVLYKTSDDYTVNSTENDQLKRGIINRMINENYFDSLLSIISTYSNDITRDIFNRIIELSIKDNLEEALYRKINDDGCKQLIDYIKYNNIENEIFITCILDDNSLSDELKDKLICYLLNDSFKGLNLNVVIKILDSKKLNEDQINKLVQKIEKTCSFNEKLIICNNESINELSSSFYNDLAKELLLKGNNSEIFWFLYSSSHLIDKALKEKLIKKVLLTEEILYICLIALYIKTSLVKEIANSALDVLVVAMHESKDNNDINDLLEETLEEKIDDPSKKIKRIRRRVMKINENNKE